LVDDSNHNNVDGIDPLLLKRFDSRAKAAGDMIGAVEKEAQNTVIQAYCPCRSQSSNYCIAVKGECKPDKACSRILSSPAKGPITPTFQVMGYRE
jgi:hypothetical protein